MRGPFNNALRAMSTLKNRLSQSDQSDKSTLSGVEVQVILYRDCEAGQLGQQLQDRLYQSGTEGEVNSDRD